MPLEKRRRGGRAKVSCRRGDGSRGPGGGAALTKRRLLHPMRGERVMDSEICTWVDLVILLNVMRHSEVGGERSCEIVGSLGKSDLSKEMSDFLEA